MLRRVKHKAEKDDTDTKLHSLESTYVGNRRKLPDVRKCTPEAPHSSHSPCRLVTLSTAIWYDDLPADETRLSHEVSMKDIPLWQKLKRDFDSGLEKVQWFASLLHERLTVEISLFRHLNSINELEKKKEGLFTSIGTKIFELSSRRTVDVFSQTDVRKAIKDIKDINTQIEEIKKEAGAGR